MEQKPSSVAEDLSEVPVCHACTYNFLDLIETPFNGHLMSPGSPMTLREDKLMANGDATTGTTEPAGPTAKPQSQNLGPAFQSVPVSPDPHLTPTHIVSTSLFCIQIKDLNRKKEIQMRWRKVQDMRREWRDTNRNRKRKKTEGCY